MKNLLNFDCIVIGGGSAGLSAALYLKRANLNVAVIEKSMPGGQMNFTSTIENYPGIIDIDGPSLAAKMYTQVVNLGVEFKNNEVIKIKKENNLFHIETNKEKLISKYVILATGRNKRKLGLPNEDNLVGKGLSYCAFCDGMFYKEKDVVVIGGGNSAVEEALHLSHIVKSIKVLNRRDYFKAEELMVEKLKEKGNVEIIYNNQVEELKEKASKLSAVISKNKITGEKTTFDVEGAFVFIGYEAGNPLYDNLGLETENGYIKAGRNGETNIDNLYACGDCVLKEFYQIINASSEGAMAASKVIKKFSL